MAIDWTPARRDAIRAFCDTIFASVPADGDPHGGFWARRASDFAVDRACVQAIDGFDRIKRLCMVSVIDALVGSLGGSLAEREARITQLARSPGLGGGTGAMIELVLGLCYGMIDARGANPNWPVLGYPGPHPGTPMLMPLIRPYPIERDQLIDADVCVIGSGAGGSVIAGELARRGRAVVVIEAGDYYRSAEFSQLELWAFRHLYWRGGYTMAPDGNVCLLAGATLGGGTQVNWQSCMRTPEWVRHAWADDGLDGLDGPAFDRSLDDVLDRICANDLCSEPNGPNQRLAEGARALGYRQYITERNVDPARHDPATAGFVGFGDASGARQSAVNTYLAEAQSHGARLIVRARAERILVEAGRVTGVDAIVTSASGAQYRLAIRARHVVCACGALETPALLLRSALGGPAAGRYLHLQPAPTISGIYAEDQRAWWGPPQAMIVDEFAQLSDDHGFLIGCGHHALARTAAAMPWVSAASHKAAMASMARVASFHAVTRDRSAGCVTLDGNGDSSPGYAISDLRDLTLLRRATHELVRLHEAAGAEGMFARVADRVVHWRRGQRLDSFLARLDAERFGAGGHALHSTHPMGSARLGRDPRDSVAQPTGELHGVRGVWIGDASAFPTAIGVEPMVTCMALALRTSEHLSAVAGR